MVILTLGFFIFLSIAPTGWARFTFWQNGTVLETILDPWGQKHFSIVFDLFWTENAVPERWKAFLRYNKFLWAENVVKGFAQSKFGPSYRYHFSFVSKNYIKVYEEVVHWLVGIQRFYSLSTNLSVFIMGLFFLIFFGKCPEVSTFVKKLILCKIFKKINWFGQDIFYFLYCSCYDKNFTNYRVNKLGIVI